MLASNRIVQLEEKKNLKKRKKKNELKLYSIAMKPEADNFSFLGYSCSNEKIRAQRMDKLYYLN